MNSHGREQGAPYNVIVDGLRLKKLHRLIGAAAAALFVCALTTTRALGDTGNDVTVPASAAPVIRVQMRSGTLIIRTWNQPQIHVTSTDQIVTRAFGPMAVQRALHGGDVPVFATTVQSPNGPITLPPEDFSVAALNGGNHDGAAIFGGDSSATVTLTVPSNTAFLWAAVGRGAIRMQDYHTGSFLARVHNGTINLHNVSGEAYVEVARGPIAIQNSGFDRIRARTAIGNIRFQNCTARQIEVSSVNGNVAYDNGSFAPGLARFESQNGNVAIGVAGGGVQIGAHSASGKIFEGFDNGADVRGTSTDAQATVGGGGPVVTASSTRGAIFLYDGALKSHPHTRSQWRPVGRMPNRRPRPR